MRLLPLTLLVPAAVLTVALAGPAAADTTARGVISASTVTVGSPVLFSGTGFRPGTQVICFNASRKVAAVKADSTGRFQWNMKNKAAGTARYRAVGADAADGTRTLTAEVTVTAGPAGAGRSVQAGSGGGADTSTDPWPAAAAGATGLVLAAAAARRVRRS